jgi:hypothetical protein
MQSTHSGQFTLPSGRTVFLRSLEMRFTFEGALEGSPETLTAYMREKLADSAQKSLLSGTPLVIIGADVPVLPTLKWVAEFFSPWGVIDTDPDYHSHLSVCWFSEEFPCDLPAAIKEVLLPLDWESLGGDYDMMP